MRLEIFLCSFGLQIGTVVDRSLLAREFTTFCRGKRSARGCQGRIRAYVVVFSMENLNLQHFWEKGCRFKDNLKIYAT